MITEAGVIVAAQLVAGAALGVIGTCRINKMWRARPTFGLAYWLITVAALGLALGALDESLGSPWHSVLLLAGVLLLLIDTRSRWKGGPPIDSGSRVQ